MANLVKRDVLHYRAGSSDKVYLVEILSDDDGRYHVVGLWGRRGSTLSEAVKGKFLASLSEANLIAGQVLGEKRGEGYLDKSSTVGLTAEEKSASPLSRTSIRTLGIGGSSPKVTTAPPIKDSAILDATRTVAPPMAADPDAEPAPKRDRDPLGKIFMDLVVPGPRHEMTPAMNGHIWDKTLARKFAMFFKHERHLLIVGPAGVGKDSMALSFAAITNRPVLRANLNGQTTLGDFLGRWQAKGGETVWVDGILPRAIRNGWLLILDEWDLADPGLLGLMHGVMEPNGVLLLKEHDGEAIQPAKGFRIIATANSLGGMHDAGGVYAGSQAQNHATLSRMIGLKVGYPDEASEKIILESKGIPAEVAGPVAKASALLRELIESQPLNGVWGTRHAMDFATFTQETESFKEGFEAAALCKFSDDEYQAAWKVVNAATGTKVKRPEKPVVAAKVVTAEAIAVSKTSLVA